MRAHGGVPGKAAVQRGGRPRREGIEGRLEHGGLERGLVLLRVQLRRVARLRGDEEGQVSPTPSATPSTTSWLDPQLSAQPCTPTPAGDISRRVARLRGELREE